VTVCISKNNFTNACIKKTGEFSVSILSEHTRESTFGIFGFSSSRDRDKFEEAPYGLTPSGLPYLKEGVTGYLECKVVDFVDYFTHTIFIAEVREAENITDEPPMTYAYYYGVIKGKASKNAPTYIAGVEKKDQTEKAYVCDICGYTYKGSKEEFEQLPDDWVCPICRVAKTKFTYK